MSLKERVEEIVYEMQRIIKDQQSRIEELEEACRGAAAAFRAYEEHHLSWLDMEEAGRNGELAERLEIALSDVGE